MNINTITNNHHITFNTGSATIADPTGANLGVIVSGAGIVLADDQDGRRLLVAIHTPEGAAVAYRVSRRLAAKLVERLGATILQDGREIAL